MILSFRMLQEMVPQLSECSPEELAQKLTLGTAEVEGVFPFGQHYNEIQIAKVISTRAHPEADKLKLVEIEYGEKPSRKEIVCGAPNVRRGLTVAYAPTGTYLPALGLKLAPKKIRGIVSEGMICSEKELGLGDNSSGIAELDGSLQTGTSLAQALDLNADLMIEFDNKSLTHRPDLWGHRGMARECAALIQQSFQDPFGKEWMSRVRDKFGEIEELNSAAENPQKGQSFEVDWQSACELFYGVKIAGVSDKKSPQWMADRLEALGMRSINALVDITNYVMLELGHPLHLFDADTLNGTLTIRRAREGEQLTTLDDIERKLSIQDTVIADETGPLVVAGIMGGASSGVSEKTKNVFLEVANWDSSSVRKTSVSLGLRTEASQRYEKTLDSEQCSTTVYRTLELLFDIFPDARLEGGIYLRRKQAPAEPLVINVPFARIESLLGVPLERDQTKKLLERLDFKVESQSDLIQVTVPSFRATKDIEGVADVIEEVGRMIGYDNIPSQSPLVDTKPKAISLSKQIERRMQEFLILHAECFQVMTYPIVNKALLSRSDWTLSPEDEERLTLLNPVSEEHTLMRPAIIPSLIEKVAQNAKSYDRFRLLEVGRVYKAAGSEQKGASFATETKQFVLAYFNKAESPILELRDALEKTLQVGGLKAFLLSTISIPDRQRRYPNEAIPWDWSGRHPQEQLEIQLMGRFAGSIVSVHPFLLRKYKLKGHLSLGVLNLDCLDKLGKDKVFRYRPIPKVNPSLFDCSVVLDNKRSVQAIFDAMKKYKDKSLESIRVVSVFPFENKRSVTLRFALRKGADEVFGGDELKEKEQGLIAFLEKSGFPLREA